MRRFKNGILTFCALLLGATCAFFNIPGSAGLADFLSENFIRILKLLSLPLIFLSISSTLLNLENLHELKRLFKKIFFYTLLTTLIAATVGLILFVLIHPQAPSVKNIDAPPSSIAFTFSYLKTIIPENPIQPFLENNVLGVVFIALILSVAIKTAPKQGCQTVAKVVKELFEALLRIASYVIRLLPLAIFGFTYQFIVSMKTQQSEMRSLLLYSFCVIAANLIQGLIILPAILKSKGLRPLPLFRAMLPALSTAFFTKSSSAALPISLKSAEKAGISSKTAGFSFPMCSVINMNGCAAFILITTLFAMGQSGIELTLAQMIPWIFLASLAAIGNAGVPMGCFFLTSAFLSGMGVPLKVMGLILPLYSLFDMVETALNVWSDSCVTALADTKLEKAPSLPDTPIIVD
ncbi:MAG: dicarboxylate/amino acid:cation symporter [Simkaniaceae bacterium]